MSSPPDRLNQGYTYRETVPGWADGLTALAYLAQRYGHSTRLEWQQRLERGEVALNGVTIHTDQPLKAGQHLTWTRPPWHEPEVPLHYHRLYEDAHLLAVSKPSGLPTMPAGGFLEHTLLHLVRREYPTASALHRLGRGTSGLVLFGLDETARRGVLAQWRGREVEKTYLALSSGVAAQDTYTITTPIGPVPHPKLGEVYAAHMGGKSAHSVARVLERRQGSTLFEVQIATGRPHQIRIHLASVGLPLLGDPLYVAGGHPGSAALVSDLGYALHAWKLGLTHPVTGNRVEWQAPPPAVLRLGAASDFG